MFKPTKLRCHETVISARGFAFNRLLSRNYNHEDELRKKHRKFFLRKQSNEER